MPTYKSMQTILMEDDAFTGTTSNENGAKHALTINYSIFVLIGTLIKHSDPLVRSLALRVGAVG